MVKDKSLKGVGDSIRIEMGFSVQQEKPKSRPTSSTRSRNMLSSGTVNTRSNNFINSSTTGNSSKPTLPTSASMNLNIPSSNNTKVSKGLTRTSKAPTQHNTARKLDELMSKIVRLAS